MVTKSPPQCMQPAPVVLGAMAANRCISPPGFFAKNTSGIQAVHFRRCPGGPCISQAVFHHGNLRTLFSTFLAWAGGFRVHLQHGPPASPVFKGLMARSSCRFYILHPAFIEVAIVTPCRLRVVNCKWDLFLSCAAAGQMVVCTFKRCNWCECSVLSTVLACRDHDP